MSKQAERLKWGLIGTGAIAQAFARGLAATRGCELLAVASRSQSKADQFGDAFSVPRRYGSYDALLADPDVRAVYVCTPHPQHAEWAIKSARAGKHVLCEKPLSVNHAHAMAIAEACEINDVVLMEAFMYRCHPQTAKLVELIRAGEIGQVRVIQATFSFHAGMNPESRIYNSALAGGGILDVGCYAASMARLVAGAANGKDVVEPVSVSGSGHVGSTGVDEYAVATLKFPGNILAQLATGVAVNQENVVRIFGSEGWIFIPNPWVAAREGGTSSKIVVYKKGQKDPVEYFADTPVTSFALEAEHFAETLAAGRKSVRPPAVGPHDALGNMRVLDQWRASFGHLYPFETFEGHPKVTVDGSPLSVSASNNMKYLKLERLPTPVSRLVMGVDNQPNFAHSVVMFDDFFSKGGNTFDTANIYGGGRLETWLGQWIKLRGVREQVNVIVKGAHTPYCNPLDLKHQFDESMKRLQIDVADIYIMHRDNPDIPVGEFVDVLDELAKAGRVRTFGGSNWTMERIEQANEYARKNGRQGFEVVSNNFSLARMVDPVWAGCVAASDPQSRAWFEKTQMPLFSWSSQARGFFVPERAAPDKTTDKELVRCWYSEDNFKRQARAFELAKKYGVHPINIAAAYVLCQPFPTFALIGPRVLSETRTSLPALDIELSESERRYLNLED